VSDADVEFVREALDLFISNDRDAAFARWSQDCVAVPPPEWPELGIAEGREEVRAVFQGFDEAFGPDWPTRMKIERIVDVGEGRVFAELAWRPSGATSGAPVDQPLSHIYTVKNGAIVRGDFFLGYEPGREAAGLA
jgi:ketosteroid isomerase-like protein